MAGELPLSLNQSSPKSKVIETSTIPVSYTHLDVYKRQVIRQENHDQLDNIKSSINCKFTDFHETVENVKNQFHSQVKKLDNLQQLQTNLQGDVDRIGSRSTCNTQHAIQDSRESVNFRDYRRNPLEFLGRVDKI